jgi:hypothetical protein
MTLTRTRARRTSRIGARSPRPRTVRTLRRLTYIRALTNRPRRGCRSPDSPRPPAAPRQRDARSLLPRGPTRGGPETRWPTIPAPAWSGIPRPCSRRRDSRSASGPPPRFRRGRRIPARSAPWGCQRARRCQRRSRLQETKPKRPRRRPARYRYRLDAVVSAKAPRTLAGDDVRAPDWFVGLFRNARAGESPRHRVADAPNSYDVGASRAAYAALPLRVSQQSPCPGSTHPTAKTRQSLRAAFSCREKQLRRLAQPD